MDLLQAMTQILEKCEEYQISVVPWVLWNMKKAFDSISHTEQYLAHWKAREFQIVTPTH